MNIYLIRHGETVANVNKLMVGVTETTLSAMGMQQQDAVVKALKDMKINAVYTSPLPRCSGIADALDVYNTNIMDDLKEYNFGIFEGLNNKSAKVKNQMVYDEWMKNDLDYVLQGGESQSQFIDRVKHSLDEILASDNENVLIISHGGVITNMLCMLLGLPMEKSWSLKVRNCSLVHVVYTGKYNYLVL